MSQHTGPCEPWPIDLSCCSLPDDIDDETVRRWQRIASTILWALSGRRHGPSCPITVRPCRRSCMDGLVTSSPLWIGVVGGRWIPYIDTHGVWRNASVCGCTTSCSCTELCEVYLEGPVYDIVEVVLDGVVVPPEAYRVDAPGLLVRTDGGCWPSCQDMAAPCGEDGAFCVTYRVGLPLSDAAISAVSELTCHLVKGCNPGGGCGCKANPKVTRLERQGVTMDMGDAALMYSEGRTGLPLVDLFLDVVNPHRLTSPSRVLSPDVRPARRTIWP